MPIETFHRSSEPLEAALHYFLSSSRVGSHFPKIETTSGVICLSDGAAPPNLPMIDRIF